MDTVAGAPTMAVSAARLDDPGADAVVTRAREGDEAAFRWIVESYTPEMRRVAFLVCGDLSLAEEAVAAAWPRAWRALDRLKATDSLRPWLVSIAANQARGLAGRAARRAVREIAVEHVDSSQRGLSNQIERAEAIDLANAFAKLAPADRELVALRYVGGLTSTELARATGLTPAGTRARLQRLLERLRRELGE
ncbi:MAG TPA: sigma-70 family RNA polymerase sigma factor [Candidatus Limnocylindrales bacterium]|nr:sigma-70 family RNA polymerase sigma factor [Candidatus Limnocylindrales bacterium]